MKMSHHIHHRLWIKNHLITLVILILLTGIAWLTCLYPKQLDLTVNQSNTLSKPTKKVLLSLNNTVNITAYVSQPSTQSQIKQLISKYRRIKKDINLQFIAPNTSAKLARDSEQGAQELISIEYQGRTEKIPYLDETTLSNALFRLNNVNQQQIGFISGQDEPSSTEKSKAGFSLFAQQLKNRNINIQTLKISQIPELSEKTTIFVLAAPQTPLLSEELDVIFDIIRQENNLLLLTDPGNRHLRAIEDYLGIYKLPGVIVSDETAIYDLEQPKFLLINKYHQHAITENLDHLTLFPYTAALSLDEDSNYTAEAILSSSANSWTETDNNEQLIQYQPDSVEKQGPLTFAYALNRNISDNKLQRIVVIGDSDFLTNAYFAKVGNAELGQGIIDWLLNNDQRIDIPANIAPGQSLDLSAMQRPLISFIFLLAIPITFMLTGFIIWHKRKRR